MRPISSSPAEQRSRRSPGRPRGGEVVADRAELLAAAERAIRSHGAGTTLDHMASEGRVSKPTLYRTVGDKDAIVMALSESLVDRIDRAVSAATAPSREPRAAFASSVHAYLESVAADRNVFLFVNAGGHDTEQLRRLVDRSSAGLIDTFVGARRAAGLDPTPAITWAHAIIGAFQMVTVMWLGDEYCDLDAVAEHLTQLFWPGIAGIAAG